MLQSSLNVLVFGTSLSISHPDSSTHSSVLFSAKAAEEVQFLGILLNKLDSSIMHCIVISQKDPRERLLPTCSSGVWGSENLGF
jgi:hypothetical protein